VERVAWGVDGPSSGSSRFENNSFERECFVSATEEMMAHLEVIRFPQVKCRRREDIPNEHLHCFP
jgi:hypothetical protein